MLDNLTVIVPYFNGGKVIDRLLKSLPKQLPIIIIDDLSDNPLTIEKDKYPGSNITVIEPSRKGYFAGAVNIGIQHCSTDVLVLNQDVWFNDTTWYAIIDQYRDRYAMIGEKVKGEHPTFGSFGYIHGTFMFLRRDAIKEVGLLNEKDYPLWGNTAEWQLRAARKGFDILPLDKIEGFFHDRPSYESFGSSIKELLEKEPQNKKILIRTPPILSIIIPCYNYGKYIKDCINSLIGGISSLGEMQPQTLQSFEVIIIDDASTDDSWEKIQEVSDSTKGIRSYRLEKNVGTARALNYGIERAVGKYITFLSADDMRESDSLEKLVQACEDNPHSFSYDDIWLFHSRLRIKKWNMEDYDFESLIHKNQIHAGIVYPKEAWHEVGGYPAIMNDGREDWAFNIALGLKGWCGIHIKNYGYLYRREGQNRTETNTSAYHLDYFRDKVRSIFPAVYRGQRPMSCCGRSNNNISKNLAVKNSTLTILSENGNRMADSVGQVGMVRIKYNGRQASSTWHGDVTYGTYIFGIDKQTGWVDKRDVGAKEDKKGFLSKRDNNGNYLFSLVEVLKKEEVREAEPAVVVENNSNLQAEETSLPKLKLVGTLTTVDKEVENKSNAPDPTDMNVEEIKRLDLTKEQWTEVYKTELSHRARKGAISWLEEKIASFD